MRITPKFTTPCIIYKNTPELHEKLRELGYTIMCGYDTGFIMTWAECGIAFIPEGPKVEINKDSLSEYIDCGTNEAKQTRHQWQKDMAHWANRRELWASCDFKQFKPRKDFECRDYFNNV